MATTNGGQIKFGIKFQTDKSGLNEISKALQQVQNQASKMYRSNHLKTQFEEAATAAKQLEQIIGKSWNDKLGQLNLDKLNQGIKSSYGGVQQLKNKLSLAGSSGRAAFNSLGVSVLNTNTQLRESNKLLDEMATSMANTVKWGITSSIFNNITSSIQSSFYYAKDLDRQLNNIRIVTGDSADQMQRFAKVANSAAKDLGRSTLDYTKAATAYYQQGLSDQEVQARTQVTLKAQNITGVGSEMVDYLTAVWNGFGATTEQVEGYVDKLAKVADSSASDMSQLAIAMSKVASTANVMGVDVDQLTAQLGTVIAVTRQAPEAVGTAFKTIYSRLNDIKTGAEDAEISLGNYSGKMAALGFNVLDANGRLRETGQVMEQIGSRWDTLSKEQQIYLGQIMGGMRQVNQITSLFENWDMYSELLNDSLTAEGTLLQKNDIYLESTAAHMKSLQAETERTADVLFDTDTINFFTDALNKTLTLFNDFIEGIGGGTNVFAYFGSVVVGVFNKQIAQSVLKAKKNLDLFLNTKDIQKFKQSYAAAMMEISNVSDVRVGKKKNGDSYVEDKALQQRAKIQSKLYADSLKARQGLNKQQEKELNNTQEQIGKLTEQKELLLNLDKIKKQYSYEDYSTAKEFELKQENLRDEIDLLGKSLSLVKEKAALQSKSALQDFQEKRLQKINSLLGKNTEYLKVESYLKKKLNVDQVDEKLVLEEIEKRYKNQTKEIQTVVALKQLVAKAERGEIQNLDEQIKKLSRIEESYKNVGNSVVKTQNTITYLSAAGQALTSIGGALSAGLAEGATAADKLNAAFSGVNGTVGAILTAIPGLGPAVGMIWNGVTSIGKALLEVTGIWDKLQDHFKTTEEKLAEIQEKTQETAQTAINYSKQKNQVKGLADQFEDLARKRSSGISLTEEEQARYHQLVDAITQYNDKAVLAYDTKGQKIVNNNKLIQDTIDLLDKQYQAEMRNAYDGANAEKAQKTYAKRYNDIKQEVDMANEQGGDWEQSLRTQLGAEAYSPIEDLLNTPILSSTLSSVKGHLEENLYKALVDDTDTFREVVLKAAGDTDKIKEALDFYRSRINRIYKPLRQQSQEDRDLAIYNPLTELLQFLNNQNNSLVELQKIEDTITARKQALQSELDDAEKLPITDFMGWFEWNETNGHNEGFLTFKEKWGDLFEKYGRDLYNTQLQKFLEGYEGYEGDNEVVFEQGNAFIENLASISAGSVQKAEKSISNLNKDIDKKTVQQYKKRQQEIAQQLVSANQEFLNNSQNKDLGLNILEDILGFSFEIDQKGIVTEVQSSLEKIKKNISNNASNTDEASVYNFINQEELDDFIKNSGKTEQQLLELSNAIEMSGKSFTSLAGFELFFNNFFDSLKSEDALKKVDKIVSAITKLQSGKQLKYSEKQNLMEELGLTMEDLQNSKIALEKLEEALMKIDVPEQRLQALAEIYQTLDSLNASREKLEKEHPGDYQALWERVYQNEIDALKINNEFLEEYAKNKNKAFNSQQEKQQVLNLYKQSQGLDKIKSSFKGLIDDIKNNNFTPSINDFITSLNEVTGQNVDFTWLKNNIETVKALFEDTNISADQLINSLTLLSQGKNIDLPETTKLQQDSNRYDLAKSAYDKLSSGKVGEVTSEERQALIYLQQQNQQLQQKDRYSKQYTEELRKQLQVQKESLEKERQEAIIQKEKQIADLNNRKASVSGELDSLSNGEKSWENYVKIIQLRQQSADIDSQLITANEQLLDLQQQQAAAAEQKKNKLKEQIQTFSSIRTAAQDNKDLSDQQMQSLSGILDTVLAKYPQLNQAADILKDKWLVGTESYKNALQQVNQALHQIQLDDLGTSLEETFGEISQDLDNLRIGVDPTDFESFVDQVNNFLDLDKQLTITVHSNAVDEFEHMSNELDRVYSAAGKIGQNFIVAANDIREVSNVFPGILQGMQTLDDGSIQLNANIVQRAIGTAQTEIQVDKKAQAEKIKTQGELLLRKAASYRAMAEAARIMAQAQIDSSVDSSDAQADFANQLANIKSTDQELAAQNALDNNEKVATNSQQNAEITGENWGTEMAYATSCVTEFARVAMHNFEEVAKLSAAVANGETYTAEFWSYIKPARTGTSRAGIGGTASSVENQFDEGANRIINGNATYQDYMNTAALADRLAELNERQGQDNLNMYAQLIAQGQSVAQALNNVAQGYGVGGKKEDKTSNSNQSNNSGGKTSGSGDLSDGSSGEDLLTDGTDQQPEEPQVLQLLEEELDRYHDINIVLKNISTTLSRVQKQQAKLTGKDLVKNLNQQLKILQAQKTAQQEKLRIAKQEAAEIRDTLSGKGVNFDTFGNISNYADILKEKQKAVNDAIEYYNSLTVEEQQAYKATIQALKQDYEDFKSTIERYDTLVADQIPKLQDDITETVNDAIEARITKFRLQIELDLDTTQAERRYNEFSRNVIQNLDEDNVIGQAYAKIDDLFTFYGQKEWLQSPIAKHVKEATEAIQELQQEEEELIKDDELGDYLEQLSDHKWFDDVSILEELDEDGNSKKGFRLSKLDTHGGQIGVLTQQIYNDLAEIRDIDLKGSSKVYGTDKQSALQHLKEDMNTLMSSMEQFKQIVNEIENSIFDVISQTQAAFDEQLQQMGFINDAIDHGRQLTEMIYGDEAFDRMQHFYQAQQQNDNRQLDFLRKQTNFWKEKLDKARADFATMNQDEDEEGYARAKKLVQQYQQLWMESSRKLDSTVQSSVENLINKYKNAVEKIFDALDKRITGQRGIEKVAQDWQLINTQADRYLDSVNTAYEITRLQNAFEEAINDNEGNISAQASIRDLMNQQLKLLKDKDKVNQYDIQRAEALLQIEMKRLALEDRRNSKTKLRLRRDSQGNYSYQYVADEEDAAKTQEELQKAQIDLYNLTKKSMIDNQKELLSTYKDWQSAVKDVTLDTTLTVGQQQQRISELNRYYGDIMNGITADNYQYRKYLSEDAYNSLAKTYLTDASNFKDALLSEEKAMDKTYNEKFAALYLANVKNFDSMTQQQKEILIGKMVPQWDSSIQTMAEAFTGAGGFEKTVIDSFGRLADVRNNYEQDLTNLEQKASMDFKNIQDYTDEAIEKTSELIQDNDELLAKEVDHVKRIQNIIEAVRELKQEWGLAKTAGEQAVSVANDYLRANNSGETDEFWDRHEDLTPSDYDQDDSELIDESDTSVPSVPSSPSTSSATTSTQQPDKKDNQKKNKFREIQNLPAAPEFNYKNPISVPADWPEAGHSKRKVDPKDKDTIQKIAFTAMTPSAGWEAYHKETGHKTFAHNLVYKIGDKAEQAVYKRVVQYRRDPYDLQNLYAKYNSQWDQLVAKYGYAAFKTGGYTGDWADGSGRIGILHEKELILNQSDTKNILSAVNIVRSMNELLSGVGQDFNTLGSSYNLRMRSNASGLSQNVTISASFPNVNSREQIENAFNNLINRASQYAYNTRR